MGGSRTRQRIVEFSRLKPGLQRTEEIPDTQLIQAEWVGKEVSRSRIILASSRSLPQKSRGPGFPSCSTPAVWLKSANRYCKDKGHAAPLSSLQPEIRPGGPILPNLPRQGLCLRSVFVLFSSNCWVDLVTGFGRWFRRAVGRPPSMDVESERRGCRWLHGIAREAFT